MDSLLDFVSTINAGYLFLFSILFFVVLLVVFFLSRRVQRWRIYSGFELTALLMALMSCFGFTLSRKSFLLGEAFWLSVAALFTFLAERSKRRSIESGDALPASRRISLPLLAFWITFIIVIAYGLVALTLSFHV